MARMPSNRNILAQYKRETAQAMVSRSGGRMKMGTAMRIANKHSRVISKYVKSQGSPADAATAVLSRTKACTVGGRPPTFSEVIANPIGNGWAALLGLAAVGGIGTAIYYAMKKPDASTGV